MLLIQKSIDNFEIDFRLKTLKTQTTSRFEVMMKAMFANAGNSQENTMKPPNALTKNITSVALASTGTSDYIRASNTSNSTYNV
jgi:hypothetical protein